jgi:N-carbamoylputrescine amidase
MRENVFRLGLVQTRSVADPEKNLKSTVEGIRTAAARGAEVICTQELFRTPYFCQTESAEAFDLAESIPGPTTQVLQAEAKKLGVVLIGSLFERRVEGLYHNTAVIVDADGSLLGTYRKMHIPDDPGFYEKYYFTPGDQGFRVWRTRYADIGVLICWDQWFPEAARLTALQGAELLLYPTAIGWLPSEKADRGAIQRDSWRTIQRSHAIANGCFVAAVNRVGTEIEGEGEGIEFWGSSFVAGTSGEILAEASLDAPEVVVAELDRRRIKDTRIEWPFFRDRRIDAYEALTRRFIDGKSSEFR